MIVLDFAWSMISSTCHQTDFPIASFTHVQIVKAQKIVEF